MNFKITLPLVPISKTTCATCAYQNKGCEFESRSWLMSVNFSGTPVSSINKTDRHDTTEILLTVALNTKTLTQNRL